MNISIKTDSGDASGTIVNAVVDAYLTYVDEIARNTHTSMLSQLLVEKSRHQQLATKLQENIQAQKTKNENVSFDQEQLVQVNKIIERIDYRILEIQAEFRAPCRIIYLSRAVTSAPKRW